MVPTRGPFIWAYPNQGCECPPFGALHYIWGRPTNDQTFKCSKEAGSKGKVPLFLVEMTNDLLLRLYLTDNITIP